MARKLKGGADGDASFASYGGSGGSGIIITKLNG
jgi:hypothetical protein